MSLFSYIPIIKTGDAELKALDQLNITEKQNITPVIELTRGRKSKNDSMGMISNRIKKLEQIKLNHFFIDLTGDPALSNIEIDVKRSSQDAYKEWRDFCINLKTKFPNIYPVLQIEETSDYHSYISNLGQQILSFLDNFQYVMFRVDDSNNINIISDIENILKQYTNIDPLRVLYMFDSQYIRDASTNSHLLATCARVLSNLGIKNIVISSTSYPNSVTEEFGSVEKEIIVSSTLYQKEENYFANVKNITQDTSINWIYSDYASINPIRNDNVIMARGWIPRIDIPLNGNIYLYRKRRDNSSYAYRYQELASFITKTPEFTLLKKRINCWGIFEIEKASEGIISGANIIFWISVRVNIYLSLKLTEVH